MAFIGKLRIAILLSVLSALALPGCKTRIRPRSTPLVFRNVLGPTCGGAICWMK
jgi:hypothetical protein